MPFFVRVRIPDQPGALGRLAAALGEAGADIESVVVVDRTAGEAVDDLIVTLPPPAYADSLVTTVLALPGVVLETIQPHPGRARVHDELALLDEAAVGDDPVGAVVRGLPDLFTAHYAFAVAQHADPPVVAASVGAPDAVPVVDWLPLSGASVLDVADVYPEPAVAGPDCTMIAAPLGSRAAIILARNGGAEFRHAEVLRLAHLANVLAMARTVAAPEHGRRLAPHSPSR